MDILVGDEIKAVLVQRFKRVCPAPAYSKPDIVLRGVDIDSYAEGELEISATSCPI